MLNNERKPPCATRGYTLLEILFVLAIAGLLAMMAAPAFRDTIGRNAREAAMLDLMTALSVTRTEAVTQGRNVAICRSTNQTACAGGNGGDWDDGWIIFTDAGTAGAVDGAAGDTILQTQGPGNAQNAISLKNQANTNVAGDFLRFDFEGGLTTVTNRVWFKLCPRDNAVVDARAIWIEITGRASFSTSQPDGIHHDVAGADITCP